MKKQPTLIIATGGTGGHIYPALRVAEMVKEEISSDVKIHFVGTRYGMEEKIIKDQSSYPLYLFRLGRLNRNVSFLERIKTFLQLPVVCLQSLFLILKLKPSFILGMGGNASGPLLLMGALLRRRTLIWEPNRYPGLTNRILAPYVKTILISLPETKKHFQALRGEKIFQVSYPIRKEVKQFKPSFFLRTSSSSGDSSQNFTSEDIFFKTDDGQLKEKKNEGLNLLVLGGSQGAFHLNTLIFQAYKESQDFLTGIYLIHQTGEKDFKRMKALFEEENKKRAENQDKKGMILLSLQAFLHNIGEYYNWADLVLCRSGMGTLFELSAVGKPSILIPYPHSSDSHQLKNAKRWESFGASLLILEKDLNVKDLLRLLSELKNDKNQVTKLSLQAKKLYPFEDNKDWIPYLKI